MVMYRRLLLLAGVVGLSLLGFATVSSQEQRPAQPGTASPPRLDRGKTLVIEPAIRQVVANSSAPVPPPPMPAPATRPSRLDVGKSALVEPPIRQILAGTGTPNGGQFGQPPAAPANFVNPKVEPGKVKWHPSYEAARVASAKSRKPVLLFQLLGKLDDQFC